MDIKNLKQKVLGGVDDGTEFALVEAKSNTVYIVQAHSMEDALKRVKHNQHTLSNDKAVLIPGIWEYDMAFIG